MRGAPGLQRPTALFDRRGPRSRGGRIWPVTLTVSALRRIRDLAGLDLARLDGFGEDGPVARVSSDPLLLASVLWAAVQPDAIQRTVSETDFQDAISGDAITAGAEALLEALADFFPGAQSRLMRKVVQTARELREKAEAEADRLLASPELAASIRSTLSNSATASPASSASTPAP